jgi:uncharacterized protein (TIGR00725 family)
MKITIGFMGSSAKLAPQIEEKAYTVGKLVAEAGAVLITGATTGLPLIAARGAKEAGGEVLGFSPAFSAAEHVRAGLPMDYHDLIIYTGLTSKGRNLLNVRASQALIFAGGSMGALNEFTIAYDEEKIIGILEGSGGFCNHLQEWMRSLEKPDNRAILHYSSDPNELVKKLLNSLKQNSQ